MRILVVGATGAQGGGVARHLLERRQFTVRALTRRADSPAACELRRRGAEVIAGDLANRATIRAALKDCYGVFGMMDYRGHLDREAALAMNLVNAVAGSAIEHFVLSARPAIRQATGGSCRAGQGAVNARVEGYARSLQLPATYLQPALYFEALPAIVARTIRTARQTHRLPAIAAADIGGIVAAVLERPEQFFTRTIAAVGDVRTLDDYARLMQQATCGSLDDRSSSEITEAPAADPDDAPDLALDDLVPLIDSLTDRHTAEDAMAEGRALHPEMHSYESWLRVARG